MTRSSALLDIERLTNPGAAEKADAPVESRRRFERHQYRARADVLVIAANRLERLTVDVRELSRGGMGFIANRFLAQGVTVIVFMDHPGHVTVARCSVRHCRPSEGGTHHVGVRFEDLARDAAGQRRVPMDWLVDPPPAA